MSSTNFPWNRHNYTSPRILNEETGKHFVVPNSRTLKETLGDLESMPSQRSIVLLGEGLAQIMNVLEMIKDRSQ